MDHLNTVVLPDAHEIMEAHLVGDPSGIIEVGFLGKVLKIHGLLRANWFLLRQVAIVFLEDEFLFLPPKMRVTASARKGVEWLLPHHTVLSWMHFLDGSD
jgi:hypothetical protein